MNPEEKAQEADRDLQRDLAEIAAETEQHKSDNEVEIAQATAEHTHPELALKDHHHEQFDDHESRLADHHARLSALEDWIMGHGDWHKEVDHVHEDMPLEEIAEPEHASSDGATHVTVDGETPSEEKKEPAGVRHGLRHRTR